MPTATWKLLAAALGLSAIAAAQQIVIEPTNGKAASAKPASHPAVVELATAPKPEAKAKVPKKAALTTSSNKAGKALAAKPKPTPSKTEVARHEPNIPPPGAQPARKVYPSRPAWAMNDTRDPQALQSEIANAIAGDARLKDSAIQVKVEENSVTLEGRAAGTEERLQAERLAQSYAWNRKLVDKIEIAPRVAAQN